MEFFGCNCIEHELVLDHMNMVRHCSYHNKNHGGRAIIYENFDGTNFSKEDFFNRKNHVRNSFRKNEIPSTCIDCIHLIKKEWDDGDYINYILLTPWTDCNSKCTYCPVTTDKYVTENTKKYDYYSVLKYMFDNDFFVEGTIFDFAGGEPTMYKRFDDILKLISRLNDYKIVIHTNSFKHSKIVEKLIPNGKCNILTSIDAGNRDLFYKIKRVDAFKDVCTTLSKYSKAQKNKKNAVKTKYIIIPGVNDKQEYILEWLYLNKKLNIISVVLNLDFNWLINNQELIEKQKDAERTTDNLTLRIYDLIDFTITEAEKLGIRVSLYGEIFTLKTQVEGEMTENIVDY